MPREMRHTAGGRCRRQVWRRKTSRGAEDASGGRRHIGRRKMHRKAEDASEGGGGVRSRSRVRDGKAWRKGVPLTAPLFNALASQLAPASVKPKSEEDLIRLDTNPNNLPVHPEILKLDPASSQYDPDNFDFTKIEVNRVVSPALSMRTTVPLGSIKVETSRPPNPTPPPQPLFELTRSGFLEATKTNEQRLQLLAEVKEKNEKLHMLLHASVSRLG